MHSEGTMPDVLENGAGPSSSKAPRSSVQPSPNNKRKKGKTAAKRREAGTHLHILDSHVRLNFLHQAAVHLSCQSSGLNDGYAKLSRRYAKLFRDVLKTERVKIMPDIVQTFCKKCKQVFVAKIFMSANCF
ncbi:RNAse P Rpr2/Rpp21 subunit domain protein [Necator americanus]|uniref:RNAse P Rpr2/Rpp21 subunit domain protein n=1 Tax=Necator americanus TaxID=51031 RepID=W2TCC3_NECAM|nr:RNAse P Rpr2/Rpp21 subunit domain protein [Necator americanus]ETN79488.1 RNAse P Rpr2/Rpp21 subunit domain protein [Necator americanus]